jgi:hypothetical protein
MVIWTKAGRQAGRIMWLLLEQNSTPGGCQARGAFSGGPEAKLERAKSTQLNFASQSVTTTYHYGVDATVGRVVQLAQ